MVVFIGSVRVVGQGPLLDAFDNGASKVGYSGCVFEVLCRMSDELVEPSCPRVAEVQMRYGLELSACRKDIRYSAASVFLSASWLPVMAEFDHKGSDIISECRNCCSIGSPIDGIIDVVGPIVALLDVRSDFVPGEFFRECFFPRLVMYPVPSRG
jgi:hypothetical protein